MARFKFVVYINKDEYEIKTIWARDPEEVIRAVKLLYPEKYLVAIVED